MQALITVLHVLVCIAIIVLVLMQHGKGADAGAAFGSGSSGTMFGSAGSMSFFMKITALCAAIFFATSLVLSYLASYRQPSSAHQIFENMTTPATTPAPVSQPKPSPAPSNSQ